MHNHVNAIASLIYALRHNMPEDSSFREKGAASGGIQLPKSHSAL